MKRRTFIQTLMISTGTIFIGDFAMGANPKNAIKVSMIYNNVGKGETLVSEWGLSILVENEKESILFDTGGDPEVFWQNIESIGCDINKISNIVISHKHWDHINGLPAILGKIQQQPKVLVPEHDLPIIKSDFPGIDFIGVDQPMKISDFIWTTGQLEANYKNDPFYEQSIIIKDENSLYLFTGCSHPGIVNIVEKTRSIFPDEKIKLVAGGFHMLNHSEKQVYDISTKLKNLNVEKIAPSHCTGDVALAIFQDEWENDFVNFDLSTSEISI